MTSRAWYLKFVPGNFVKSAGTYGGATYGSDTYGRLASDPLSTVNYEVSPYPGWRPQKPGWQYRKGDTSPMFRAIVTELGDSSVALDVSKLREAHLVYERLSDGPPVRKAVELTINTTDNSLDRTFVAADLYYTGTYRVAVVMEFLSGRLMTVPAEDQATLAIRDVAFDASLIV